MIRRFLRKPKQEAHTPGFLKRKSAGLLLQPYCKELKEIEELTGLPKEHFEHYYMKPLERYVESIQLLPASESHHHSHVGGMLQHTIEVLVNALRLRRGQILPPGILPEEIEQRKDIWTYAVYLCALLHDVGKIITDQRMASPDSKKWNLLSSHPMPGEYECQFNLGRKHKFHEKLPAFVIHKFIDPDVYDWLMQDDEVFSTIVNFMSGDMHSAGMVGEIVQKADQASVVANLGGDMSQAVKSPAQRPLSERLLRALQTAVQEGRIKFNGKGAMCFTTEEYAYFVSKPVLDELKERLRQDGQSVPDRNDRLMDELQQFGVVEPNGDQAIWRCQVKIGDWQHNLSMLKFHIGKIWPNIADRPEPNPTQTITPVDADGTPLTPNPSDVSEQVETTNTTTTVAETAKMDKPSAENTVSTSPVAENVNQDLAVEPDADVVEALAEIDSLIGQPEVDAPLEDLSDFNDSLEDDYADYGQVSNVPYDAEKEEARESGQSINEEVADAGRQEIVNGIVAQAKKAVTGAVAKHNEEVYSSAEIPLEFDDPSSNGAKFIKWLVSGIRDGSIEVNQPSNRVHVVEEGLFLVSPAIFRMFHAETGGDWSRAQREVTKKRINLKNSRGENIFTYEIFSKSGRNNTKKVKGLLIPNFEQKLGIKLNDRNPWMKQKP